MRRKATVSLVREKVRSFLQGECLEFLYTIIASVEKDGFLNGDKPPRGFFARELAEYARVLSVIASDLPPGDIEAMNEELKRKGLGFRLGKTGTTVRVAETKRRWFQKDVDKALQACRNEFGRRVAGMSQAEILDWIGATYGRKPPARGMLTASKEWENIQDQKKDLFGRK